MISTTDTQRPADGAGEASRRIRKRLGILMLASMMTVALAFGVTFYVALIANESAVARQIPELQGVAGQLKNLLIMNTVGFAVIIIGSLLVLSSLTTSRMFQPLEILRRHLLTVAGGAIPKSLRANDNGPFAAIGESLDAALSSLRERERREIEELERIAEAVSTAGGSPYAAQRLREMTAGKRLLIGETAPASGAPEQARTEKQVFIQPL